MYVELCIFLRIKETKCNDRPLESITFATTSLFVMGSIHESVTPPGLTEKGTVAEENVDFLAFQQRISSLNKTVQTLYFRKLLYLS